MALTRQISRIAKLLVDAEGISFTDAERRLRTMTLEIRVVGEHDTPAAHAAILTALAVGRRSFVGGVRIVGARQAPLRSPLFPGMSLEEALASIGTSTFYGPASARIHIGRDYEPGDVCAWWNGWQAGVRADDVNLPGRSDNPLAGVAAGAMAVGAAFQRLRGITTMPADIDMWPGSATPPEFGDVYLPSALWLMGLGNLGQAFLWNLAALPYAPDRRPTLFLQDYDRVSEENWGTSILVPDDFTDVLKSRMAEQWADARGFRVQRLDRALRADLRVDDDEPRLALCGFDKVAPRRHLADTGFHAIVDVGLGRTATDFDRFRVNVFDCDRRIDQHFAGLSDPVVTADAPDSPAYAQLEAEIGRCGAAEIGNASVAVPYVSAVAAAVAVSRAIAVASGQPCVVGEVQRLSASSRRAVPTIQAINARGVGHAGHPQLL